MAQILNGTYEVLELVGKGGMSTVFKARHIRLDTIVAVKSVRKDQAVDLAAEVNILTKLNHPNLVRVIDIFEDEKLIYIVMDFVEGEDLQHVIRREKVIPEEKVIEWFRTLAELLRYLHTRKPPIIYRDMKPANVILQNDGTLKLVDFGIAREYKAQAAGDTTYIGTNGFAAPEQFGLAQSDGRTDIYSLGMTMYYLATGKSPLEPPYGYTPARKINPAVSEKLEAILEKCIKYNPEDRYQSADELLKDLNDGITMPFPTGTVAFKTEPAGTSPWTPVPPAGTAGTGQVTPGKKTPFGLYAGIGVAVLALIAGVVILTSGRGSSAAADSPAEAASGIAAQAAEEVPVQTENTESAEPDRPEESEPQQQAAEPEEPVHQEEQTEAAEGSKPIPPKDKILFATSCQYMPASILTDDAQCIGFASVMLEQMMEGTGAEYELKIAAPDVLQVELMVGGVDAVLDPIPIESQLAEDLEYTDPYYREGITVILENGMDINDDVNRLSGIRTASVSEDPMVSAFISKFNMNSIADLEIPEHISDTYDLLGGDVQAIVVRQSHLLDNSQLQGWLPYMTITGKDLYEKYGMVFAEDPDLKFMVRKNDTKMKEYLNSVIADMDENLPYDCLMIGKELFYETTGRW
ncbi:MAG: protein kinase [Solobacterium sp.]|nr:protein kinase [Solobacterium sp.]